MTVRTMTCPSFCGTMAASGWACAPAASSSARGESGPMACGPMQRLRSVDFVFAIAAALTTMTTDSDGGVCAHVREARSRRPAANYSYRLCATAHTARDCARPRTARTHITTYTTIALPARSRPHAPTRCVRTRGLRRRSVVQRRHVSRQPTNPPDIVPTSSHAALRLRGAATRWLDRAARTRAARRRRERRRHERRRHDADITRSVRPSRSLGSSHWLVARARGGVGGGVNARPRHLLLGALHGAKALAAQAAGAAPARLLHGSIGVFPRFRFVPPCTFGSLRRSSLRRRQTLAVSFDASDGVACSRIWQHSRTLGASQLAPPLLKQRGGALLALSVKPCGHAQAPVHTTLGC